MFLFMQTNQGEVKNAGRKMEISSSQVELEIAQKSCFYLRYALAPGRARQSLIRKVMKV